MPLSPDPFADRCCHCHSPIDLTDPAVEVVFSADLTPAAPVCPACCRTLSLSQPAEAAD